MGPFIVLHSVIVLINKLNCWTGKIPIHLKKEKLPRGKPTKQRQNPLKALSLVVAIAVNFKTLY